MMRGLFLPIGGGDEIGASSYYLQLSDARLLLDAGMRIGRQPVFPDFTLLNAVVDGFHEIDTLLITHAHLDHCGALTRVQAAAPRLEKLATQPTLDLADIMLEDALRVSAARSREDWGVSEYTRNLLTEALKSVRPMEFRRPQSVGAGIAQITPLSSGHILGAAAYLIEAGGMRVLFTGDYCLHDQHTIAGASILNDLANVRIDVMITESTYAYQPRGQNSTALEQRHQLLKQIRSTVAKGGHVLIPAFALGRAQEIACLLSDAFEQEIVDPFPVRLDGLVRRVSECYNKHREYLNGRAATRDRHAIYSQWVRPVDDDFAPTERQLAQMEPTCFVASSGMLLDGTRSARYAETLLQDPDNAILFSGYLDVESPGRRLVELADSSRALTVNGRCVQPRANIGLYHLSAHASAVDLQHVILALHPETLILVHGDPCYQGDAGFIEFLMSAQEAGIHVHQPANGVPVYF
jgi:Cft2 family RNA processing exonuclease